VTARHGRSQLNVERRSVAALSLIALAAGCVFGCAAPASQAAQPAQSAQFAQSAPAPASHAGIQVENAWVPQPPPGADVAAAYFTVRNTTREPAVLVEVSSPLASQAMLHETRVVGGESRMRMLERLVIPAGGTVTLHPDAIHVMLQGLGKPIAVGEEVPLVLRFASGQQIRVSARVRPLGSQ
jgi:periplasmic copper chaperone A